MSEKRILKRYSNRRLYDVESGRTVNLHDVTHFIRSGSDVRVVDNVTGEDITSRVLGHAFMKISTVQVEPEFSTFLLSNLIREVSSSPSRLFKVMVKNGLTPDDFGQNHLNHYVELMVKSGFLESTEKDAYLQDLHLHLNQAE